MSVGKIQIEKTNKVYAPVVKLADTQDLGSCAERRAGSIPVRRTIEKSR